MSKFRTATNQRLLQGLFLEQSYVDKTHVLYTLKDTDHRGYPSLYKLYMAMEDLTEWRFANAHLESWEHWEMLCKTPFFKPIVARWRKELELKIKAEALQRLRDEATAGTRNSYNANKFLIEKGWVDRPEGKKVGRPNKEEIKEVFDRQSLKEDLERVSLQ